MYLGDYEAGETVPFCWNSNDGDGASATRSTNGSIKVIRDDNTDCTGTSVTDSEDAPFGQSLTGVHGCKVNTADNANFIAGHDYFVFLSGAVIDTQTVNRCLAHFSLENRYAGVSDGADYSSILNRILKAISLAR